MSRAPRGRASARKPAARRPGKPSMLDRIMNRLPVSQETLQRIATWSILGAVGLGAVGVATWMGVPGMVGTAIAEQVGNAGFRVEKIEVRGVRRMDAMTVYAVALDQKSRAMPLVDLNGVRDRLMQYGWVQDAHVSRRLPDTLLVRIVERTPAAVWQDQGQLSLIDRDGVYLEQVSADAMPDLPLVIGPGADRQEPAYQRLMSAAPALKPRVRAATWVGNRRWDILFQSGETLSLPEGDVESAAALRRFAELEGTRSLLGKGWVKFDMRDPKRLVARKPDGSSGHDMIEPSGGGNEATPATGNRAPSSTQV